VVKGVKRIAASSDSYTQLLYLRARYYSPADGRFNSRDTWGGEANRPLSLNRWNYVDSNPVNAKDPGSRPDGSVRLIGLV
jgi:RHS repeat-associated protein